MEKVNVTCRLSADDVAFLDDLGEQLERDRSYLIKRAVANFIEQQRWQVDEVQRTIAAVDAGEFLTDKEFEADTKKWRK